MELKHLEGGGAGATMSVATIDHNTRLGYNNSTILLRGIHTSEEMLAALHLHFPQVAANLRANGVELVEVRAS